MSVGHDNARVAAILRRTASSLLAADEVLAELADADCDAAIAELIADRIRVPVELVHRALHASTDEAVSVMCRAAGLKINGYSALLRMRRRQALGAALTPAEALTYFSSIAVESAERIVKQMAALEAAERGV